MYIAQIALGLGLGLIGIGILAMIVSGIKSVMQGKQDLKRGVAILVPFVVYGISYAMTQQFTKAGIATMLFMIGVMFLLIALTGLRTTFKF